MLDAANIEMSVGDYVSFLSLEETNPIRRIGRVVSLHPNEMRCNVRVAFQKSSDHPSIVLAWANNSSCDVVMSADGECVVFQPAVPPAPVHVDPPTN